MYKALLVFPFFFLLAGCRQEQPATSSPLWVGMAPPRPAHGSLLEKRDDSAEQALYCRTAKVCVGLTVTPSSTSGNSSPHVCQRNQKSDPAIEWRLEERRWKVRPVTANVLASLIGYHYEIIKSYDSTAIDVSPAVGIFRRDRFTLSFNDDQLWLTHDRGDSRAPVFVAHARLSLRPYHANLPSLWAQGYAYSDAGGSDPAGVYRVFLLEDAKECLHSNAKPGSCQRLLFEFYDSNDELSARNAPVFGENLVSLSDPTNKCQNMPPVVLETSDGEGDEGPNKPR